MAASGVVYPAGVASVNGEVGDVELDAADVSAPGPDDTLTVAEGSTIVVNRPTMVDPATAADLWRFAYDGQRTGYANEYGNLRSRGAPDQVAFRCQCHSSDNGTGQVILDVTLSDNTTQFSVDALGDARTTRDLYVTRNIVLAGQTYSAHGAWTAPTYEANAADAGGAWATAGSRLEFGDLVRLRGRVDLSGSFSGGATILTLPAGHRPSHQITITVRTAGTGAANTFIDISAAGALTCRTALNSGAQIHLDGVAFPRTAS